MSAGTYRLAPDAELRDDILHLSRLRRAAGDIPSETADVWGEVRRRERLLAACEQELLAAAEELARRVELAALCGRAVRP